MRIRHKLKTKTEHVIPINGDTALANTNFKTIHTRDPESGLEHTALAWELPVATDYEGKYTGHSFTLEVGPQEIDKFIHALTVAKERFSKPELPVEV